MAIVHRAALTALGQTNVPRFTAVLEASFTFAQRSSTITVLLFAQSLDSFFFPIDLASLKASIQMSPQYLVWDVVRFSRSECRG